MHPLVIHSAVTWMLVGLIWTVQVVSYPLFRRVGTDAFAHYHLGHCQRLTALVIPLILAEAATAGWVWWTGERSLLFLASLGLMGINWLSTSVFQGPIHARLLLGSSVDGIGRLNRTNWIRTVSWSLRGMLLAALLLRGNMGH